jgi:hypothetical protein
MRDCFLDSSVRALSGDQVSQLEDHFSRRILTAARGLGPVAITPETLADVDKTLDPETLEELCREAAQRQHELQCQADYVTELFGSAAPTPQLIEDSKRGSQASQLVKLAQEEYRFGMSRTGDPFAVATNGDGPHIARPFKGGRHGLRASLANKYAKKHQSAPSNDALASALLTLEGQAMAEPEEALHLRVARHEDAIVIDLGRHDGKAVVCSSSGWRVVDQSPALMRRTELTGELPIPTPGGGLGSLRALLNVSEKTWPLVIAWTVAVLLPEIPQPILLLRGLQGTAKTSAARSLAMLLDPSGAPTRSVPKDVETWALAADGSYVVALDNITHIPEWLADALCRGVTGDGLIRRRLYADNSLVVVNFRRAVILTAIDPGALRGDLAERLLPVELERIEARRRRTDEEVLAAFSSEHSRMFGGVLDVLARVMAILPDVRLAVLPRMADFARVMVAVDRVLGTDAFGTYTGLADEVALEVVEGDPVGQAVRDLVNRKGNWVGLMRDLLSEITPEKPRPAGPRPPSTSLAGYER